MALSLDFRRATAQGMLQELRHGAEVTPAARGGDVELAVEEPGPSVGQKSMGKPWENHRKMIVSWDSMGFSWDLPNLVMTDTVCEVENNPLWRVFPSKMVIFHSYLKLPDGIYACIYHVRGLPYWKYSRILEEAILLGSEWNPEYFWEWSMGS